MEVGGTPISVHGVAMSMKLHLTLKRMLVHPKDKCTPQKNLDVVYQVPCKDCRDDYTGEIERRYGVRENNTREMLRHVRRRSTLDHGRKSH